MQTLIMSRENIIGLLANVEAINLANFYPVSDEVLKDLLRPFNKYSPNRDLMLLRSQETIFSDNEIKEINHKSETNKYHHQINNIALATLLAPIDLNQNDVKNINEKLSKGIDKKQLIDLLQELANKSKDKEPNLFFRIFKAQPPKKDWKGKLGVDESALERQLNAVIKENKDFFELIKHHPPINDTVLIEWMENYVKQLRFKELSAHLIIDEQHLEMTEKLNASIGTIETNQDIHTILDLLEEDKNHINEVSAKPDPSTVLMDSLVGVYREHFKDLFDKINALLPKELASEFREFNIYLGTLDKYDSEETTPHRKMPVALKNKLQKILQGDFTKFETQLKFALHVQTRIEPVLNEASKQEEILTRNRPTHRGSSSGSTST
jgi:hypothetical protein